MSWQGLSAYGTGFSPLPSRLIGLFLKWRNRTDVPISTEKRRKLGMIKSDQFYYYKSAGGNEIDLVFEADNTVYAIEIKSTRRPAPRDLHNLGQFSDRLDRPVRRYLVYLGEEYRTIDNIQLIPAGALFRGQ